MTTPTLPHEPPLIPRVVTTRRYEFVVPYRPEGVDVDQLVDVRDRALAWLRAVPLELDPDDLLVRYADDLALVVSYEVPPTTGATDRSSTVVTDALASLRDELRGALDVHYEASWDQLVDVVRNRTALASVAARTVRAVNDRDGGDGLILALLPRDWPRRLDAQLANAGNQLGLVGLIRRLLDDWVLAAQDVVDATRSEVARVDVG